MSRLLCFPKVYVRLLQKQIEHNKNYGKHKPETYKLQIDHFGRI